MLEGIGEHDEELVHNGLEIPIDHHDEDTDDNHTDDNPEGISDRVSRRVTALVMLAQQRGIDLDIESRYIPNGILSGDDVEE